MPEPQDPKPLEQLQQMVHNCPTPFHYEFTLAYILNGIKQEEEHYGQDYKKCFSGYCELREAQRMEYDLDEGWAPECKIVAELVYKG